MDSDDRPIGTVLSRRDILALMGTTGALLLAGCKDDSEASNLPAGTCVVRPELTEGPYFVDEQLNRSDIRSDPSDSSIRPGSILDLTFNVTRVVNDGCVPVEGLFVDVWHCDAAGTYSDVQGAVGKKFLRGYQVTNADGVASFRTIYPGWYTGRAVHVHFKIRSALQASPNYEFTSQFFFDDAFTDQVYTAAPYNTRGARNTRNANDGIYQGGGQQLLLDVDSGDEGYAGVMNIALTGLEVPTRPLSWSAIKSILGLD